MPYDKYNRWIPPDDGYDPVTGYNWLDHRDTDDLIGIIDSGGWEKIGIGSLKELGDLYNTPEWEALDDTKRIDVIKEFQDAYHGDRSNFPWKESDRATEEWGLDIRRTSDADGGSASDWEGAYQFFNHMASSEIYPADSKIDWASYNDVNLYDAARKEMVEKHSDIFGDDYMNKYDTVKEVRTAQDIINSWTEQEKQQALDWADTNVTPNKKGDDDWIEFYPTRKFDTKTNTTTYYDNLTGKPTGETKTWLPPDPPQSLKIVNGKKPLNAPANTYYNPQKYGTPASIKAKMVKEPAKIKSPTITIRDIGEPKKPTQHYMALNDTVWTDPSVDTRSTRWDPGKGKMVSTGKPRKNASFPTSGKVTKTTTVKL